MQKISALHPFNLEIQSILESCEQTDHIHIWPLPPKKMFDQLLIYVILYQHVKNQAILLIFSGNMVD